MRIGDGAVDKVGKVDEVVKSWINYSARVESEV